MLDAHPNFGSLLSLKLLLNLELLLSSVFVEGYRLNEEKFVRLFKSMASFIR